MSQESTGKRKKVVEERGFQCCAYGCKKRWKKQWDEIESPTGQRGQKGQRSDSEGSDDEESEAKRKFPRSFHMFPANDPKRCQMWVKSIHRKNWMPSKHSRVCSDHFREADIDRKGCRMRLMPGAIPARFKGFPNHLKKLVETPHKPQKEKHKRRRIPIAKPASKVPLSRIPPVSHDHSYSRILHQVRPVR